MRKRKAYFPILLLKCMGVFLSAYFSSPQYTQYCLQKTLCLNRSIRSMHFFSDQAKESVISVISAQCLQFIHQPVKQESRVSFTSCSLADSHLSFTAKSWWLWEYSVAFCNHLPFASSVALRISGKDAEVVAHPPSTSMVPLGTLVTTPVESGGLRTPKPSPGPVVHRVLPRCSFQTLRWCLTDPMSFYFTQFRRTEIK